MSYRQYHVDSRAMLQVDMGVIYRLDYGPCLKSVYRTYMSFRCTRNLEISTAGQMSTSSLVSNATVGSAYPNIGAGSKTLMNSAATKICLRSFWCSCSGSERPPESSAARALELQTQLVEGVVRSFAVTS